MSNLILSPGATVIPAEYWKCIVCLGNIKQNVECEGADFLNVDYLTIQQFTGLKDKNGREIYEGDNIEINYYPSKNFIQPIEYGVVTFRDGCFWVSFRDYTQVKNLYLYSENLLSGRKCKIKIIGNAFENPELLKNK